MISMLFGLGLVVLQAGSQELPQLAVDEVTTGDIDAGAPVVRAPALEAGRRDSGVVGKRYRIEVDSAGIYTIELRSSFFDAFLVLRDGAGGVLAEDHDGAVGTQARLTVELAVGVEYLVDACALDGEDGPFELELRRGRPAELSLEERRAADRADLERSVQVCEQTLGPEHPRTATRLNTLGVVLFTQGKLLEARPVLERALAIREKVLGPDHALTAVSLTNLGSLFRNEGDLAAARSLFERALEIDEIALGPEHPELATNLNNLARVLQAQGEYELARPLLERAVEIDEIALGPEHQKTAKHLTNLAGLLWAQGERSAARPLFERALAINEAVLGPGHSQTATAMNDLAMFLREQGDFSAARALSERALEVYEQVFGPEHTLTATLMSNLGLVLRDQGDYAAARPLFERALAIQVHALGPEHPETAASLDNLANLLRDLGDYAPARALFERALAIREKRLGREHPKTASVLNSLAALLRDQRDYAAARSCYERAIAIAERALGPDHPDVANSLHNLAVLLQAQGDHATARPLIERALAIEERAFGPEHPSTPRLLGNLAVVFAAHGDHATAQALLERALSIDELVFGPEHPETARDLWNLSIVLLDRGLHGEAARCAFSALRAKTAHAEATLWSLSERERLSYLSRGERALRLCLSPAVLRAGGHEEAYDLSSSWRGMASRALLASREALLATLPEGAAAAMQRLHDVQAELSKRLYATEIPDRKEHEREIQNLRRRRNELEVEVERLAGPAIARAPSLAELRQGLEPGAALLDFLVHRTYSPAELDGETVLRAGEWSEDRLSAWIVRRDRELVHVDLGPAAPIAEATRAWLEAVVSDAPRVAARGVAVVPGPSVASDAGARLTALLWRPLSPHLGEVARVFVRPDSFLATLPLGVLPLEGGRYLIEELDFVYVDQPNDLVAKAEGRPLDSLLAMGGVDFRGRAEPETGSESAPVTTSARLDDALRGSLGRLWPELPHTEIEARTVSELFETSAARRRCLLLVADAPTEERLKRELPLHAVAHLATHGFFHPADTISMWDSARESLGDEAQRLVGALPGLLSGLACAGANERAPEGRDDGWLTAEEVLWLDLSKVELVVLSACETALGEHRSGEGMIGLRRAFGLAGAKTVVSSLWSVKDHSTSELMRSFYEHLLRDRQGRSDALRHAQLEMLARHRATEKHALPSTWGAFVSSGEWR